MLWDAETKGKNIHTAKILDVTMQMHWDDEKNNNEVRYNNRINEIKKKDIIMQQKYDPI